MSHEGGAAADEDFVGLVEELEDIERRRSGSGNLTSELAARRQHVERRVLEILTGARPDEARRAAARVRCDLLVRVAAGDERAPGAVKEMSPGGAMVETALSAAAGELIELEVTSNKGSAEALLRLRAQVMRGQPAGRGRPAMLDVSFPVRDEGTERRMRRFVLEVVRGQIGHW